MTANDYQAVQVAPNFTPPNVMREIEERAGYGIGADDVTTIDLPFTLYVVKDGIIFALDPDDVTSVHDGVSVLVSNDGKRFKSDVVGTRLDAVLDRIADPPALPNAGDAYIITSPATGEWAGREDDIALFSLNGWLFVTPAVGFAIFVRDELGFYHVLPDGTWTSGLGAFQSTDGSLSIAALDIPFGLAVEAEQNDPPGGPVDGTAYIVGGAPTGAWGGENQNIALRRSGLWVFVAKYHGAIVYDRALDIARKFDGANWVELVSPGAVVAVRQAATSVQQIADETTFWDYGAIAADIIGVQPTSSDGVEMVSIIHTANDASNELVFDIVVEFGNLAPFGNVTTPVFFAAIFIDSETVSRVRAYLRPPSNQSEVMAARLSVPVIDTSQHTYKLRAGFGGTTVSNADQDVETAFMQLNEVRLDT